MKHFISLGAGVQSSTMALMAAHGAITPMPDGAITPMPDGAIFADTQAEPAGVYRWLDWLEKQLPFPVHRVTAGNLREAVLTLRTRADGVQFNRTAIPVHTRDANGNPGHVSLRNCTRDFKIRPIQKAIRQLAQVPRGTSTPVVCSWIGISLDEMQRMKPNLEKWVESRWPLIEKRITRHLCLEWMKAHDYPEPPRSACTFCPFRSNEEWRSLKMSDPEGFSDAVVFDASLRTVKTSLRHVPYVHRQIVPLDQADLRNDLDRGQQVLGFLDECEGMCGV